MRASIKELMTPPEESDPDYEAKKADYQERPHLKIIYDQLVGNVGMIFSNGDLSAIKDILDSQSREAPAKVGSIAPDDVTVQPGPTGLDPKQTAFFQALSIQTKIFKAQIEIVSPVTVIVAGDKINGSQAALLDKLKICPFEYKMHIKNVLDNGKLYPAAVLSIKAEDVLAKFQLGANNLTCMSLGSGYVTKASAPHLIMNAFKNLACVSFATDYSFPQAEKLKSAAAAGPAAGAASSGAGAAKVEEKEEEPAEEEADVDMGDLFGGDY
jgi:large subunit ribosomal protein LP0